MKPYKFLVFIWSLGLMASCASNFVQHTVSFEANGGTPVNSVVINDGKLLEVPNSTKTGYTIEGWYSSINNGFTFNRKWDFISDKVLASFTLYANWIPNQITVSFDTNGGTPIEPIIGLAGESISESISTSKIGNTFAGWFADPELTQPVTVETIPSNSSLFYAKWLVNQYTITFFTNGGNTLPMQTYFYSDLIALTTPERNAYDFVGWFSDINLSTLFTLTSMPAQNLNLYAKWMGNSNLLKVWGPNYEQSFLQAKAEEFKTANPNVDVEFEFAAVDEPSVKSLLTLDIAGGADVFAFPDDQLQDLVTAGALSPVEQNKADVVARNIDWALDLAKIGDTVYAYPNTADNGVFMYYDKRFISEQEMVNLDTIIAKAQELNSNINIDPMGGWAMSMWFATSGNISWNAATRQQTIDWNNEAGLNSAKGMFNAYASNRVIRDQGLMPTLFLENETDITKGIIAGVSGTWNATSITTILGAENIGMIKMPTFTNGAGAQVQLGSMVGGKQIGVNAYSQNLNLSHQFANFLTNTDTQKARAIELGVSPSNITAAADPLVQAIPSIKAISDQAPFGIPQAKSVSSFYWTSASAFADAVINEAREIDSLVETNLQAALTANTVQNNPTAIATFRTTEKARLIALSHAKLQGFLNSFAEGVLAVNER